MKSQKITVIISLALLFVACILIGVSFFACNNRTASIFNGLGFGILGSAIVTFAVSIGEYSNEKRLALENYYSEAYGIKVIFNKIVYCECDEEKDLLVAYDAECKVNDMWDKLKMGEMNRKSEAQNALLSYYRKIKMISNDYSEQQIQAIIFTRKTIVIDSIEKSIESYMKVSKVSLKGLENAYGMIDFFTKNGNTKHRAWIYQNIHTEIRNSLQSIIEACYYFEQYKNGDLRGNLFAAYDQLKKVNGIFFSEASLEKAEDGYEFFKVTASIVSDIDSKLEELRYRIYKDNIETVEPTVIMVRHINIGVNENV